MTTTTDDPGTALVKAEPVELGILRAADANEMVRSASSIATVLAGVIEQKKLFTQIKGRRHVNAEGWGTLIAMLGITAQEESNVANADGSFTATVKLTRIRDGAVVGKATADCGDSTDAPWDKRPRYARRSMAATRAMGKACRLSFSWIMALAGFDATPGAEMPTGTDADAPPEHARPAPPAMPPEGVWEGRIVGVETWREGRKTNGQPWTLYKITGIDEGGEEAVFSTFSTTTLETAKKISGKAAITYKLKKGTLNIESIEPHALDAELLDEDIPF